MVKRFDVEEELVKKYFWKEIFSNHSKLLLIIFFSF